MVAVVSDGTPNTDQVRQAYVTDRERVNETFAQHYMGAPVPDYGAEFDRWLDDVKKKEWAEGYTQGQEDTGMA
jgi:hypothetical protein